MDEEQDRGPEGACGIGVISAESRVIRSPLSAWPVLPAPVRGAALKVISHLEADVYDPQYAVGRSQPHSPGRNAPIPDVGGDILGRRYFPEKAVALFDECPTAPAAITCFLENSG